MQQREKTMSTAGRLAKKKKKKKRNYPNCPSAGEWRNYGKVINGMLHRYMHQHT